MFFLHDAFPNVIPSAVSEGGTGISCLAHDTSHAGTLAEKSPI
jgi:hypothetical protein